MAELGRKRKAAQKLEDATKRMRIETSTSGSNALVDKEDEGTYFSEKDSEYDSEDEELPTADTPLTPFSPSRKFPSEFKTIKCTYEGCTKTFNRPARLRSHLRSHTNERPFACNYPGCDKTYMEEKHLKQHIKGSHTHEKSYQCDWEGCTKSFLTATRLRRHRDAHEGRDRYRCTAYPPCKQTFRKHQTLQRHIRADHLGLDPFSCPRIDLDTNSVCNAGFETALALRKHEARVHGALRFWCDECSSYDVSTDGTPPRVGFRTQNELIKHVRTEHSNCIFCDLKCNSQTELQKHIEIQHSSGTTRELNGTIAEQKSIPCMHLGCRKTFVKKSNLQVHIRTAHNGERFTCSSSNLPTFKSPDLISWNGENACGKDFVSKASFEDHIRTQHLCLPSIINAKRIKGSNVARMSKKSADDDADDLEPIKRLTGLGYIEDATRNIPCIIADCPWRFIRQYDLEQHLQLRHNSNIANPDMDDAIANATAAALQAASGTFLLPEPRDQVTLDAISDQAAADWEWEMENSEMMSSARGRENSEFWIGAPDQGLEGGDLMNGGGDGDDWLREEEEMRRLIGPVATSNSSECDNCVIDPVLRGL